MGSVSKDQRSGFNVQIHPIVQRSGNLKKKKKRFNFRNVYME